MENKKDLGKLFKERLSETEVAPDQGLWTSIEKTLDQQRRRQFYFIWVASLLILLVGGFIVWQTVPKDYFLDNKENQKPDLKAPVQEDRKVTHVNSDGVIDSQKKDSASYIINPSTEPAVIVTQMEKKVNKSDNKPKGKGNKGTTVFEEDSVEKNTSRTSKTVRKKSVEKNSLFRNRKAANIEESSHLVEINHKNSSGSSNMVRDKLFESPSWTSSASTAKLNTPKNSQSEVEKDTILQDAKLIPDHEIEGKTLRRALGQSRKRLQKNPKDIRANNSSNTKPFKKEEMLSVKDSIPKEKKSDMSRKDSLSLIASEEKNLGKLKIYPFIGTSSYGNLSKASTIDSRLSENKKEVTPQLSYGVLLILEPDEKWGVRLGVAHNALEKKTRDVPIDPNNLNTNYNGIVYAENLNYLSFSSRFAEREEIILQEKLSYFEIPVEVSYTLWHQNSFGLDAIVGIGVQKRTKNEIIYIRPSGESGLLGSNSTYAEGSFGFHLGLGINYQLGELVQLNVEPMFKPQIGFYENNVGDRPFIFNLQFGLKYKL